MKLIYKIWWWLTTSKMCSWCNRITHYAILGIVFGKGKTSHIICPRCYREVRLSMVKPVCAELTEPSTPFVVK